MPTTSTSSTDTAATDPASAEVNSPQSTETQPEPTTEPAPTPVNISVGDWVRVTDQQVLGWDWHGEVKSLPDEHTASILWDEFPYGELSYKKNQLTVITAKLAK